MTIPPPQALSSNATSSQSPPNLTWPAPNILLFYLLIKMKANLICGLLTFPGLSPNKILKAVGYYSLWGCQRPQQVPATEAFNKCLLKQWMLGSISPKCITRLQRFLRLSNLHGISKTSRCADPNVEFITEPWYV